MEPITCQAPDCDVVFEPRQANQRFHATVCRVRAARAEKAAAAQAKAEAKAGGTAEHSLVRVVRAELTKANALMTLDGQIAMVLANRAVEANAAGVSTLMTNLRVAVDAAKASVAGANPDPTPTPTPEANALEEARRRRDAIASAAAAAAEGQ